MTKRTFNEDYTFGLNGEGAVLDAIRIFDPTLQKTSVFHPFDFVGTTTFVELKTRRNKKDTYPTTMISQSKVDYAMKNIGFDYVFCFLFEDGLYYIKFDKEKFARFEVRNGGRYDRGRVEENKYCYIPVDCLTLL
jgi:hypothetical protein